ncbi:MAG TPA: helix-turn-helix transcriptional regulator [Vicinamibacterales bacterium]|jgi:PadR family transcriptional regulator PadR|nr:helix-turn-helix transcriptional regulator [Vicinamibacterales bacterium]
MPQPDLGEMEHLVLLAILRLGREAYGIPIMDEVASRSGRAASKATIYVALKRLERKGFVSSRLGEATAERGGRAKRYFRLRPAGLKAMRDSRAMLLRLWRDYETVLDRA